MSRRPSQRAPSNRPRDSSQVVFSSVDLVNVTVISYTTYFYMFFYFFLQPKHEQKLIYSGQLLNDSAMLKDVLRQYDGQETHTVHLVCSSSRMAQMKPQQSQQQPSQRTVGFVLF